MPAQLPRQSGHRVRSGQNGRIEQKGKVFYVRFWLDVPGHEKRVYKAVRICPVSGPGSLNKFELKRRAKDIIAEFGANSEKILRQAEAANLGTTFKEQAERWLGGVQTRKRKPIKPRTADAWVTYLSYINPLIGQMPLSEVNNLAVKEVIATMAAEKKGERPRFSSKSISNYVQVVKMVVASAVTDKGEQIYPVKWNHDFMDLPEIKDQRTPANVLFRPLARKIDRQPSRASDVETRYVLRLVCRSDDEAKVRMLLMHLVRSLPLTLHALHSEDLNSSGKVEVRATLVSAERQNALLDIVQRLSIESGISAVSWELDAQETE